jgi:WD40 repeat protein
MPPFATLCALADHNVYLYDLRSPSLPLATLCHHTRPVSYVKFLDGGQLVSASTDSSLALWDLGSHYARGGVHDQLATASSPKWANGLSLAPAPLWGSSEAPHSPFAAVSASSTTGQHSSRPSSGRQDAAGESVGCSPSVVRVLRGHRNDRHFVGLGVTGEAGGLIACGSESSSVYTYHTQWDSPLAQLDLSRSTPTGLGTRGSGLGIGGHSHSSSCSTLFKTWGSQELPQQQQQQQQQHQSRGDAPFVSTVAWQGAAGAGMGLPPLLAAGTSIGDVRLLMLAAAS